MKKYQEFFSKYSYDRRADIVGQTRFGLIYNAVETKRDNRVLIRIMHVADETGPTLEKEVEFVNELPSNPYIQRYSRFYRFQESTGEVDCAVMDYYPLGNMTALLENWKLDSEERKGLRDRILQAAGFLRDNGVKIGQFVPESIYVSEEDGQLIPHLTDLSNVEEDNADYESQVKALLGDDMLTETAAASEPQEPVEDAIEEPVPSEPVEADEEETEEAPARTRKWVYLAGVVITWVAIIALIYVMHISRNSTEDAAQDAADSVKVEKVLYPADEFAMEEAARADSIEKARADSIAAFKADSAAYMKRMAEKARAKAAPKEPTANSAISEPDEPVAVPAMREEVAPTGTD